MNLSSGRTPARVNNTASRRQFRRRTVNAVQHTEDLMPKGTVNIRALAIGNIGHITHRWLP